MNLISKQLKNITAMPFVALPDELMKLKAKILTPPVGKPIHINPQTAIVRTINENQRCQNRFYVHLYRNG